MTAEIIDFQKYRERKLREREFSEPIAESEIQERRQSQEINSESGAVDGEDSP